MKRLEKLAVGIRVGVDRETVGAELEAVAPG